jgi:Fe-S oxidoreductase
VHIAPFVPNGKALHVKGFLRRFERRARKTVEALRRFAEGGATLVAIEPAVGLTYRDEYRHVVGKDLGFEVELLQELLVRIVPDAQPGAAPGERYRLFGHCTEKTLAPASQKQWAVVFARLGLDLDLVSTGCCGMSGAFGHERIHREESEGIWELSWGRWLGDPATDAGRVLATGYSCRSQAHRFGKLSLRHPAEVLLAHLSKSAPP